MKKIITGIAIAAMLSSAALYGSNQPTAKGQKPCTSCEKCTCKKCTCDHKGSSCAKCCAHNTCCGSSKCSK